MSLLNLLIAEHREIESLLTRIQCLLDEESPLEKVASVFEILTGKLYAHIEAEEKAVYRHLLRREETRNLALESTAEHQVVVKILARLQSPISSDQEWQGRFTTLRQGFVRHAREEEGEVLSKMRQFFSQQEIDAMGADMERVEEPVRESDSKSEMFREWFADREDLPSFCFARSEVEIPG